MLEIDKELNINRKKIDKNKLRANRNRKLKGYANSIVKGTRRVPYNLEKGTRVYIFRQNNSDKLKERWKSGYIIVDRILPDAYCVKNIKTNNI
ncbi:MAG: hypothetical protein ACRC1D_00065 [Culicoidibacterales bacterium]